MNSYHNYARVRKTEHQLQHRRKAFQSLANRESHCHSLASHSRKTVCKVDGDQDFGKKMRMLTDVISYNETLT